MITRDFFEHMGRSEDRYRKREADREARDRECQKLPGRERDWKIIDSPERFIRRLTSKGLIQEARAMREWRGDVPLGFDPYERILEDNELTSATTLYQGAAQTHSVARVVIRTPTGRVAGYGTGFLVSPRLLLTNNHVLDSDEEAAESTVEFFFWEDLAGRTGETLSFALEPRRFFETDVDLDFTLVAVQEQSGGPRLTDLGFTPLIGDSGKAAVGEPVNIIQHPRGGDQKVVLRQNKIVDVVDDFLHYQADTQRGSSGSPVFNVDWELAALHHSSVPKRDEQGRILLRGDVPWNGDRAFLDQIQWIANEGVRISSIVRELRGRSGSWSAAERTLFDECFRAAPRFVVVLPGVGSRRTAAAPAARAGSVAEPEPSDADRLLSLLRRALRASEDESEADDAIGKEAILRDYSNRRGYRSGFLGSGRFRLRLPRLRDGSDEQEGTVLPYHHFTVVMNPERRLARYTASNIHGRKLHDIRRADGQTGWIFDKRLDRGEQIGNDLYKNNPLDRGHMVRRLDAAWGRNRTEAMAGNDDTFHYTNSVPQHEGLNEDDESWAGLEDHYLDHARAADRKISVFTGPVFRANDPEFESPDRARARIPRQFWKVIAYRRGGRLVAD